MIRRINFKLTASLGFFILLCVSLPVSGQSGVIQGVVKNALTHKALAGVVVELSRKSDDKPAGQATTDASGKFVFKKVSPGRYRLAARFSGFRDARVWVTALSGAPAAVEILLNPIDESASLNPRTASRKPSHIVNAPAAVSLVKPEAILQNALAAPADVLRRTAGVDFFRTGLFSRQIAPRGFNAIFDASHLLLIDGRRAALAGTNAHPYANLPIHPIDLAGIEVVRGPLSGLYGSGAELGAIQFFTKQPFSHPGTAFSLSWGGHSFFDGAIRHAMRVNDRLAFKIVGGYRRGKDWLLDARAPGGFAALSAITDTLYDVDGDKIRVLEERDRGVFQGFGAATVQYKIRPEASVTLNGGFSKAKNIVNTDAGEMQFDGFPTAFGQLRFETKKIAAQAWINKNFSQEDHFEYRTGEALIDKSSEAGLSARLHHTVQKIRTDFILGGDARAIFPASGGQIYGRNENDDRTTEFGAYVSSLTELHKNFSLLAAGRLDKHSVWDAPQFSPRLGFLTGGGSHRLRFIFNRGYTAPPASLLQTDRLLDQTGMIDLRLRGGRNAWTFTTPHTSSLLVPNQRYPGVGAPVSLAYELILETLISEDFFNIFPASFRNDLIDFLAGKSSEIDGFSPGTLFLDGKTATLLPNREILRPASTKSFEIGYRGFFDEKLLLNIDGYYTARKNFWTEARIITPLVFVLDLEGDVHRAILRNFSLHELARFGLTPRLLADFFAQPAGNIAQAPVGIVEPEEAADHASPELLATYLNSGEVDYLGLDIDLQFKAGDLLTVFGNFSWVSDNFFDSREIGRRGTAFEISLNGPKTKYRVGFEVFLPKGWSVNSAFSHSGGYPVRAGVFSTPPNSPLPASNIFDFGFTQDFQNGLRFDVTAQNLLGKKYQAWYATPEIGRLLIARLIFQK